MQLEIDHDEHRRLTELVESGIRELHPMIRRSRVYSCTDGLKDDLHRLEQLLERLRQLKCEVV